MIKICLSSLATSAQHAINTTAKLECYENYDFYQRINLKIIKTPHQAMAFKSNRHKNNNVCLYLGSAELARSADVL